MSAGILARMGLAFHGEERVAVELVIRRGADAVARGAGLPRRRLEKRGRDRLQVRKRRLLDDALDAPQLVLEPAERLAKQADRLEQRGDRGAQPGRGADVHDLDGLVASDAVEAADALLDRGRVPRKVEEDEAVAELEVAPFAAALGGEQQRRPGRQPELGHLDVPLAGGEVFVENARA